MKRLLNILRVLAMTGVLLSIVVWATPALAATSVDISVTATPSYISISSNQSSYDFGIVTASTNYSTDKAWANIDNTSSVATDQTIAAVNATWIGGTAWTHSDTAEPGADTIAMWATKGATWGTADVIVKNASPNEIVTNQAADTDYQLGLRIGTPTTYSDGVEKSNVIRISASAS